LLIVNEFIGKGEKRLPYRGRKKRGQARNIFQWGAEHFDEAWKERTGTEVPGWMIGENGGSEEGKSV